MIEIVYKSVKELVPYARNSRTHSDIQISQIMASIKEFGFTNPVLTDGDNGIIAGHGRVIAAQRLGMEEVPTIEISHLTEAQKKAYIIADNKLALNSGWDEELLKIEIEALQEMNFDIDLLGFSADEIMGLEVGIDIGEIFEESKKGNMAKEFLIPPFSIFDTIKSEWQARKKYWIEEVGIKSHNGRHLEEWDKNEKRTSGQRSAQEYNGGVLMTGEGTSVFDPVLCEIAYKWFSAKNGIVLDPFAGGSVRGIVAAICEREYIGNDLRKEQIEENIKQAEEILVDSKIYPTWTCGDSLNIKEIVGDVKANLLFSCPPYADLEVYSDLKEDISNMPYVEFVSIYKKIIKECYDLLEEDSFAVWVVGEVRDKKGNYYNFVGDTINAFIEAGFKYYNEIILANAIGSLPLRAGKSFKASRKIGKRHQNVLVFVKGDGKKASNKCGNVEIETG